MPKKSYDQKLKERWLEKQRKERQQRIQDLERFEQIMQFPQKVRNILNGR